MQASKVNPIRTILEATAALRDAGSQSFVEPLPGAIVPQYIRCGKQGCRCQDGEKHGPYYYRVWREGMKVHKAYVRREDVERVRAQCARHQQVQEVLREAQACRLSLLRWVARRSRESDRLRRQEERVPRLLS